MADGGGVEVVEPGATKSLEVGGYVLSMHGFEGGKGFLLEVESTGSAALLAELQWDGEQNWKLDTPELDCYLSPNGLSIDASSQLRIRLPLQRPADGEARKTSLEKGV